VTPETDSEGFEYAFNWEFKFGKESPKAFVRRRKWVCIDTCVHLISQIRTRQLRDGITKASGMRDVLYEFPGKTLRSDRDSLSTADKAVVS
jgi:hypothetical protein